MVSRSSIMPASSNSAEVQVRVQQAGNAASGEAGECPPALLWVVFLSTREELLVDTTFLVWLVLWNMFNIFPKSWDDFLQSDELHHFSGGWLKPPTSSWLRTPLEMDRNWGDF